MASQAKASSEVVQANPRLIMAVVALGMIVGALLSPGKSDAKSPQAAPIVAQAR